VIRRKGARYEHTSAGLKLGALKHRADAKLMDDARRLGVTRTQIQKAWTK
jgi:hypothetical protein